MAHLVFVLDHLVDILIALCVMMYPLGIVAAAIKRLMGDPDPERDSKLRTAIFEVLAIVDVVAANSTPIRIKLELLKKDSDLRAALGLSAVASSQPPAGVFAEPKGPEQ